MIPLLKKFSHLLIFFLLFFITPNLITANENKENKAFSFETLVKQAQKEAGEPFNNLAKSIPAYLLSPELSYDQWRDIRFKPANSLWRNENLPFEIQFFHLGLFYDIPVKINVIDNNEITNINYQKDFFDYGQNSKLAEKLPPNLGLAGFRIHYPLKNNEYKDEVAVFLGASYFKALGKNHIYGLSARGLAVDTAINRRAEEFPYFKEFWLVKPLKDENTITVYALLDSPSTTGAYEYLIIPGEETIMEVRSKIFQRHRVTVLGVAPLTSMFYYGENFNYHRDNNFRPEVHDSDGLLLHTNANEWLWRPLTAPQDRLLTNTFFSENILGYGLMQRDQNFDHYQDLEAEYHKRPSVFIRPKGNWGAGEVRLIQIPSDSEIHDNIVAFWVPKSSPEPGVPITLDYTLTWATHSPKENNFANVTATRLSKGLDDNSTRFIIDFEGGQLSSFQSNEDIKAIISHGEEVSITEHQVQKNPYTNGFRLVFNLKTKDNSTFTDLFGSSQKPLIELRAFLTLNEEILTETWSYGWAQ